MRTLIQKLYQAATESAELDLEIQRLAGNPRRTGGSGCPRYTGSMNAAALLVPDGLRWTVRRSGGESDRWFGHIFPVYESENETLRVPKETAATKELALCAAALEHLEERNSGAIAHHHGIDRAAIGLKADNRVL
jgi:hypothetical protein